MDFNDTPEQAKFRAKCREWLEANAELKESKSNGQNDSSLDDHLKVAKAWQKKKYEAGWAMLHWPKEYGGIEASPIERIIWGQEEAKFNVPGGIFEIGLGMCGPVMMQYASAEQKDRYLAPMAEGKEIWCQLFSEPAAGSDVAGLRSKAEKDGDDVLIADIVLLGVSRTSKTPTSIYLANRGYKTINIPLVLDHQIPEELKMRENKLCIIGLIADPERLSDIRRNRVAIMNESRIKEYTNLESIKDEIEKSKQLYKKYNWPIIDVTRKSVEETAAAILKIFEIQKNK